uniref:Uncharacterized protein n=1 Tax=Cyclopterus lumpus TaxID=8103 RepID=A0A8C3G1M5_CYCLU
GCSSCSPPSTTSYSSSVDGEHGGTLTAQEAALYLELSPKPERCSSLWNTWSSITDGNMASARTSLISSVDSCYTNDSAQLARLLAAGCLRQCVF